MDQDEKEILTEKREQSSTDAWHEPKFIELSTQGTDGKGIPTLKESTSPVFGS